LIGLSIDFFPRVRISDTPFAQTIAGRIAPWQHAPALPVAYLSVGGGDEVQAYAGAKAGDGLTWAGGNFGQSEAGVCRFA